MVQLCRRRPTPKPWAKKNADSDTYTDICGATSATFTTGASAADSGTYRCAVTSNSNTFTETATVTINKANSTVTKALEAKTLTYNGSAQELVTAGEATGGTMYYAVTTENTAPTDDNLYTTSIPTATDAGTYYVWYKAVGDSNHTDTTPACITVTIKTNIMTGSKQIHQLGDEPRRTSFHGTCFGV